LANSISVYLLQVLISATPLVVRTFVGVYNDGNSVDFSWHWVLIAEQPFWFAFILNSLTLLRLSDHVSNPMNDFQFPMAYNPVRLLLLAMIGASFFCGIALALGLQTKQRELIMVTAAIVVLLTPVTGLAQLGIADSGNN
jgi:uncharacterized membrane protein YphA (DoxX/SURF4 family)